jgi:hypothetical protein
VELDERFSGDDLDLDVWFPYYLPHWSSRSRSAATWSVGEGELKSGEQRFFSPDTPGFYELRVGRESRIIAINPPANEGNLEMMLPEDLIASVQSTEAEARQTGTFVMDDKLEYARRQMGWWYLLMIALIAGIVELYIANSRPQSVRRVG